MQTPRNSCLLELLVGANGSEVISTQSLLVGAWIAARVWASRRMCVNINPSIHDYGRTIEKDTSIHGRFGAQRIGDIVVIELATRRYKGELRCKQPYRMGSNAYVHQGKVKLRAYSIISEYRSHRYQGSMVPFARPARSRFHTSRARSLSLCSNSASSDSRFLSLATSRCCISSMNCFFVSFVSYLPEDAEEGE